MSGCSVVHPLSNHHCHLLQAFNFHRRARVILSVPAWDLRDFVNDNILDRDDQFFVGSCRTTESVVEHAFKHQPLDCEGFCLVPDFAESVFKLVYVDDERPQDVVKVFHVFRSVSITDVADERCVRRVLV